jgi:hypothetical protein
MIERRERSWDQSPLSQYLKMVMLHVLPRSARAAQKQQLRKNDSARMLRAWRLKKNALAIYQHPMSRTQICNSAERLTTTGAPHGGR